MTDSYAWNYLFIGLLALGAIFLGVVPLILAKCVSPKKPGQSKQSAYECGIESAGDSWAPFHVQYYLYALLFVVFDVEVVFLYPWALVWKDFGPIIFAEMALFLAILAVALIYAWKKGVLEWE